MALITKELGSTIVVALSDDQAWLEYAGKIIADAIMYVKRDCRDGQALFNALTFITPEVAEELVGTDYDPFHSDGLIPMFWQKVYEFYVERL